MTTDKCWACGSEGDHATLGGHYWPCGTMKSASIRGEACYEKELSVAMHLLSRWATVGETEKITGRLLDETIKFLGEERL